MALNSLYGLVHDRHAPFVAEAMHDNASTLLGSTGRRLRGS